MEIDAGDLFRDCLDTSRISLMEMNSQNQSSVSDTGLQSDSSLVNVNASRVTPRKSKPLENQDEFSATDYFIKNHGGPMFPDDIPIPKKNPAT